MHSYPVKSGGQKASHPYARKGALHTFTSSRAGGALHAISGTLIAPNAAARRFISHRHVALITNYLGRRQAT